MNIAFVQYCNSSSMLLHYTIRNTIQKIKFNINNFFDKFGNKNSLCQRRLEIYCKFLDED